QHFLRNFYLKSKRAIGKPREAGPAAYVLPSDDAHRGAQLRLLEVLQRQHVEISRASAAFTVRVPAPPAKDEDKEDEKKSDAKPAKSKTIARSFAAGAYMIRMDQPYSRIADALLDRQYWSPDDPQKHPYDDTGWSFPHLFNLKVVRVTDPAILKATMKPIEDPAALAGKLEGSGSVIAINNS